MNTSWLIYLNLEKELIECFNYVYLNDNENQLKTYSTKFGDILLRASTEVETLLKELYRRNGGKGNTSKIKYDDECIEYLNTLLNLGAKRVDITYPFFDVKNEENRKIYPLSHFSLTDLNEWNQSYQAIKHDRLKEYKKGNLKSAIHSLAALYLLNIYLKDEKFTIKHNEIYKFDTRFGSTLFSLDKPSDKTGFVTNAYVSESSVYEYELTKASKEEYARQHKEYMDRFSNYIKTVPEMNELDFQNAFIGLTRKHSGVNLVMQFFNELSKYRVDKMFKGLTKEERIKLMQRKVGDNVVVTNENFDECYFSLMFEEEKIYISQFPPHIYNYLFNDSIISVHIARSKEEPIAE